MALTLPLIPTQSSSQVILSSCSCMHPTFLALQERARRGWSVWAASLWLHLKALPSSQLKAGQGYTDQHCRSALCLPGAMFQEWEGLTQTHIPPAPREHGQGRDLSHSPSLLRHFPSPRGTNITLGWGWSSVVKRVLTGMHTNLDSIPSTT